MTRRELLPLLAAAPAFAQSRPRVAITMDDVRWQMMPPGNYEPRLLEALGETRAFLFAVGEAVDNPHGTENHGYRNGSVTIDASDWYYDQRLRNRLKAEPSFDVTNFRQPYLDHIWNRAQYYDQLSRDVLGRSVAHTLLVHYNLLNAL